MKRIFFIAILLIILPVNVTFLNSGDELLSYAGDQWGDYLHDQTPHEYTEATGWKKIVGYVMVFGFLFFMGREIWKDFIDRRR